ncbi:MAG: hypothetical protein ACT4O3_02385, partial [Elusimicrobiota bacterium]
MTSALEEEQEGRGPHPSLAQALALVRYRSQESLLEKILEALDGRDEIESMEALEAGLKSREWTADEVADMRGILDAWLEADGESLAGLRKRHKDVPSARQFLRRLRRMDADDRNSLRRRLLAAVVRVSRDPSYPHGESLAEGLTGGAAMMSARQTAGGYARLLDLSRLAETWRNDNSPDFIEAMAEALEKSREEAGRDMLELSRLIARDFDRSAADRRYGLRTRAEMRAMLSDVWAAYRLAGGTEPGAAAPGFLTERDSPGRLLSLFRAWQVRLTNRPSGAVVSAVGLNLNDQAAFWTLAGHKTVFMDPRFRWLPQLVKDYRDRGLDSRKLMNDLMERLRHDEYGRRRRFTQEDARLFVDAAAQLLLEDLRQAPGRRLFGAGKPVDMRESLADVLAAAILSDGDLPEDRRVFYDAAAGLDVRPEAFDGLWSIHARTVLFEGIRHSLDRRRARIVRDVLEAKLDQSSVGPRAASPYLGALGETLRGFLSASRRSGITLSDEAWVSGGYLARPGSTSMETFRRFMASAPFHRRDVTASYASRLLDLLRDYEAARALENLPLEERARIESDLLDLEDQLEDPGRPGVLRIYEMRSYTIAPNDFVLAAREGNALAVARDVLEHLGREEAVRGGRLVDEYLLHALLAPVLGDRLAVISLQKMFPENYSDPARRAGQDRRYFEVIPKLQQVKPGEPDRVTRLREYISKPELRRILEQAADALAAGNRRQLLRQENDLRRYARELPYRDFPRLEGRSLADPVLVDELRLFAGREHWELAWHALRDHFRDTAYSEQDVRIMLDDLMSDRAKYGVESDSKYEIFLAYILATARIFSPSRSLIWSYLEGIVRDPARRHHIRGLATRTLIKTHGAERGTPEMDAMQLSMVMVYAENIEETYNYDGESATFTVGMGMFREQNRLSASLDEDPVFGHPNGEDALRRKIRELRALFAVNRRLSWKMFLVDDARPRRDSVPYRLDYEFDRSLDHDVPPTGVLDRALARDAGGEFLHASRLNPRTGKPTQELRLNVGRVDRADVGELQRIRGILEDLRAELQEPENAGRQVVVRDDEGRFYFTNIANMDIDNHWDRTLDHEVSLEGVVEFIRSAYRPSNPVAAHRPKVVDSAGGQRTVELRINVGSLDHSDPRVRDDIRNLRRELFELLEGHDPLYAGKSVVVRDEMGKLLYVSDPHWSAEMARQILREEYPELTDDGYFPSEMDAQRGNYGPPVQVLYRKKAGLRRPDGQVDYFPEANLPDDPRIVKKGASLRVSHRLFLHDLGAKAHNVTDTDTAVNLLQLGRSVGDVGRGYDLSIGSREHKESVVVAKPVFRKIMSAVLNRLVRGMLPIGDDVRDTQAGDKTANRRAAETFLAYGRTYNMSVDTDLLSSVQRHAQAHTGQEDRSEREVRVSIRPIVWIESAAESTVALTDRLDILYGVYTQWREQWEDTPYRRRAAPFLVAVGLFGIIMAVSSFFLPLQLGLPAMVLAGVQGLFYAVRWVLVRKGVVKSNFLDKIISGRFPVEKIDTRFIDQLILAWALFQKYLITWPYLAVVRSEGWFPRPFRAAMEANLSQENLDALEQRQTLTLAENFVLARARPGQVAQRFGLWIKNFVLRLLRQRFFMLLFASMGVAAAGGYLDYHPAYLLGDSVLRLVGIQLPGWVWGLGAAFALIPLMGVLRLVYIAIANAVAGGSSAENPEKGTALAGFYLGFNTGQKWLVGYALGFLSMAFMTVPLAFMSLHPALHFAFVAVLSLVNLAVIYWAGRLTENVAPLMALAVWSPLRALWRAAGRALGRLGRAAAVPASLIGPAGRARRASWKREAGAAAQVLFPGEAVPRLGFRDLGALGTLPVLARQGRGRIFFSPALFRQPEAVRKGVLAEQMILQRLYPEVGRGGALTPEQRLDVNDRVNQFLAGQGLAPVWPLSPEIHIGVLAPGPDLKPYLQNIFLRGYSDLIQEGRARLSVFTDRDWMEEEEVAPNASAVLEKLTLSRERGLRFIELNVGVMDPASFRDSGLVDAMTAAFAGQNGGRAYPELVLRNRDGTELYRSQGALRMPTRLMAQAVREALPGRRAWDFSTWAEQNLTLQEALTFLVQNGALAGADEEARSLDAPAEWDVVIPEAWLSQDRGRINEFIGRFKVSSRGPGGDYAKRLRIVVRRGAGLPDRVRYDTREDHELREGILSVARDGGRREFRDFTSPAATLEGSLGILRALTGDAAVEDAVVLIPERWLEGRQAPPAVLEEFIQSFRNANRLDAGGRYVRSLRILVKRDDDPALREVYYSNRPGPAYVEDRPLAATRRGAANPVRFYRPWTYGESRHLARLARAVADAGVDILHAQEDPYGSWTRGDFSGTLAPHFPRAIQRATGLPLVATVHRLHSDMTDPHAAGIASNWLSAVRGQLAVGSVEWGLKPSGIRVLVLGEDQRQELRRRYGIESDLVPVGFPGRRDLREDKFNPRRRVFWAGLIAAWDERDQVVDRDGDKELVQTGLKRLETQIEAIEVAAEAAEREGRRQILGYLGGASSYHTVLERRLGMQEDGLWGDSKVLILKRKDMPQDADGNLVFASRDAYLDWLEAEMVAARNESDQEKYQWAEGRFRAFRQPDWRFSSARVYDDWLRYRVWGEERLRTVELRRRGILREGEQVRVRVIYRPEYIGYGDEYQWVVQSLLDVSVDLRHGGQGNMGTAYEAAGNGLPIVTSNTPEGRRIREEFSQGQTHQGVVLVRLRGRGFGAAPAGREAGETGPAKPAVTQAGREIAHIVLNYETVGRAMAEANVAAAARWQPRQVTEQYHGIFLEEMGVRDGVSVWRDRAPPARPAVPSPSAPQLAQVPGAQLPAPRPAARASSFFDPATPFGRAHRVVFFRAPLVLMAAAAALAGLAPEFLAAASESIVARPWLMAVLAGALTAGFTEWTGQYLRGERRHRWSRLWVMAAFGALFGLEYLAFFGVMGGLLPAFQVALSVLFVLFVTAQDRFVRIFVGSARRPADPILNYTVLSDVAVASLFVWIPVLAYIHLGPLGSAAAKTAAVMAAAAANFFVSALFLYREKPADIVRRLTVRLGRPLSWVFSRSVLFLYRYQEFVPVGMARLAVNLYETKNQGRLDDSSRLGRGAGKFSFFARARGRLGLALRPPRPGAVAAPKDYQFRRTTRLARLVDRIRGTALGSAGPVSAVYEYLLYNRWIPRSLRGALQGGLEVDFRLGQKDKLTVQARATARGQISPREWVVSTLLRAANVLGQAAKVTFQFITRNFWRNVVWDLLIMGFHRNIILRLPDVWYFLADKAWWTYNRVLRLDLVARRLLAGTAWVLNVGIKVAKTVAWDAPVKILRDILYRKVLKNLGRFLKDALTSPRFWSAVFAAGGLGAAALLSGTLPPQAGLILGTAGVGVLVVSWRLAQAKLLYLPQRAATAGLVGLLAGSLAAVLGADFRSFAGASVVVFTLAFASLDSVGDLGYVMNARSYFTLAVFLAVSAGLPALGAPLWLSFLGGLLTSTLPFVLAARLSESFSRWSGRRRLRAERRRDMMRLGGTIAGLQAYAGQAVPRIAEQLRERTLTSIGGDLRLPSLDGLDPAALPEVVVDVLDDQEGQRRLARFEDGRIVLNAVHLGRIQERIAALTRRIDESPGPESAGLVDERDHLQSLLYGILAEQVLRYHWRDAVPAGPEDARTIFFNRLQREIDGHVNAALEAAGFWKIWPLSQRIVLGVQSAMSQEGGLAEYNTEMLLPGYALFGDAGQIAPVYIAHQDWTSAKMRAGAEHLLTAWDNPSSLGGAEFTAPLGDRAVSLQARAGRVTLKNVNTGKEREADKIVVSLTDLPREEKPRPGEKIDFNAFRQVLDGFLSRYEGDSARERPRHADQVVLILEVPEEWLGDGVVPPEYVEDFIREAKAYRRPRDGGQTSVALHIVSRTAEGPQVYYTGDLWGGVYLERYRLEDWEGWDAGDFRDAEVRQADARARLGWKTIESLGRRRSFQKLEVEIDAAALQPGQALSYDDLVSRDLRDQEDKSDQAVVLRVPRSWAGGDNVRSLMDQFRDKGVRLNIVWSDSRELAYAAPDEVFISSHIKDSTATYDRRRLDEDFQSHSEGNYALGYRIYRVTRFDESASLPRALRALKEAGVHALHGQLLLTSYTGGKRRTGVLGGFLARAAARELGLHVFPTMHHTVWTIDLEAAGKASNVASWATSVLGSHALESSYGLKDRDGNLLIQPILLFKYYMEAYRGRHGIEAERNVHGIFRLLGLGDAQTRFNPNQLHFVGSIGKWEGYQDDLFGEPVTKGYKQVEPQIETAKKAYDLVEKRKLDSLLFRPEDVRTRELRGAPAARQLLGIARNASDEDVLRALNALVDRPDLFEAIGDGVSFGVPALQDLLRLARAGQILDQRQRRILNRALIQRESRGAVRGRTMTSVANPEMKAIGLIAGGDNPNSPGYTRSLEEKLSKDSEVLVITQAEVRAADRRGLFAGDDAGTPLEKYKAWLAARVEGANEAHRRAGSAAEVKAVYRPGFIEGDEFLWLNEIFSVSLQVYHAATGTSGPAHEAAGRGTPILGTEIPDFMSLRDFFTAEVDGEIVSGLSLARMWGEGQTTEPDTDDAAEKLTDILWNYDTRGLKMAQTLLLWSKRYPPHVVASQYDNIFRRGMGLEDFSSTFWDGRIGDGAAADRASAEEAARKRDALYERRAEAAEAVRTAEDSSRIPRHPETSPAPGARASAPAAPEAEAAAPAADAPALPYQRFRRWALPGLGASLLLGAALLLLKDAAGAGPLAGPVPILALAGALAFALRDFISQRVFGDPVVRTEDIADAAALKERLGYFSMIVENFSEDLERDHIRALLDPQAGRVSRSEAGQVREYFDRLKESGRRIAGADQLQRELWEVEGLRVEVAQAVAAHALRFYEDDRKFLDELNRRMSSPSFVLRMEELLGDGRFALSPEVRETLRRVRHNSDLARAERERKAELARSTGASPDGSLEIRRAGQNLAVAPRDVIRTNWDILRYLDLMSADYASRSRYDAWIGAVAALAGGVLGLLYGGALAVAGILPESGLAFLLPVVFSVLVVGFLLSGQVYTRLRGFAKRDPTLSRAAREDIRIVSALLWAAGLAVILAVFPSASARALAALTFMPAVSLAGLWLAARPRPLHIRERAISSGAEALSPLLTGALRFLNRLYGKSPDAYRRFLDNVFSDLPGFLARPPPDAPSSFGRGLARAVLPLAGVGLFLLAAQQTVLAGGAFVAALALLFRIRTASRRSKAEESQRDAARTALEVRAQGRAPSAPAPRLGLFDSLTRRAGEAIVSFKNKSRWHAYLFNALVSITAAVTADVVAQIIGIRLRTGDWGAVPQLFNFVQSFNTLFLVFAISFPTTWVVEYKIEEKFTGPRSDIKKTLAQMAYGVIPVLATQVLVQAASLLLAQDPPFFSLIRSVESLLVGAVFSFVWNKQIVNRPGRDETLKVPLIQFKDSMTTIGRALIFFLPLPLTFFLPPTFTNAVVDGVFFLTRELLPLVSGIVADLVSPKAVHILLGVASLGLLWQITGPKVTALRPGAGFKGGLRRLSAHWPVLIPSTAVVALAAYLGVWPAALYSFYILMANVIMVLYADLTLPGWFMRRFRRAGPGLEGGPRDPMSRRAAAWVILIAYGMAVGATTVWFFNALTFVNAAPLYIVFGLTLSGFILGGMNMRSKKKGRDSLFVSQRANWVTVIGFISMAAGLYATFATGIGGSFLMQWLWIISSLWVAVAFPMIRVMKQPAVRRGEDDPAAIEERRPHWRRKGFAKLAGVFLAFFLTLATFTGQMRVPMAVGSRTVQLLAPNLDENVRGLIHDTGPYAQYGVSKAKPAPEAMVQAYLQANAGVPLSQRGPPAAGAVRPGAGLTAQDAHRFLALPDGAYYVEAEPGRPAFVRWTVDGATLRRTGYLRADMTAAPFGANARVAVAARANLAGGDQVSVPLGHLAGGYGSPDYNRLDVLNALHNNSGRSVDPVDVQSVEIVFQITHPLWDPAEAVPELPVQTNPPAYLSFIPSLEGGRAWGNIHSETLLTGGELDLQKLNDFARDQGVSLELIRNLVDFLRFQYDPDKASLLAWWNNEVRMNRNTRATDRHPATAQEMKDILGRYSIAELDGLMRTVKVFLTTEGWVKDDASLGQFWDQDRDGYDPVIFRQFLQELSQEYTDRTMGIPGTLRNWGPTTGLYAGRGDLFLTSEAARTAFQRTLDISPQGFEEAILSTFLVNANGQPDILGLAQEISKDPGIKPVLVGLEDAKGEEREALLRSLYEKTRGGIFTQYNARAVEDLVPLARIAVALTENPEGRRLLQRLEEAEKGRGVDPRTLRKDKQEQDIRDITRQLYGLVRDQVLSVYSANILEAVVEKYKWDIFGFLGYGDRLTLETQYRLTHPLAPLRAPNLDLILQEVNHKLMGMGYQPVSPLDMIGMIQSFTGMNLDVGDEDPWRVYHTLRIEGANNQQHMRYFFQAYRTPAEVAYFIRYAFPGVLRAEPGSRPALGLGNDFGAYNAQKPVWDLELDVPRSRPEHEFMLRVLETRELRDHLVAGRMDLLLDRLSQDPPVIIPGADRAELARVLESLKGYVSLPEEELRNQWFFAGNYRLLVQELSNRGIVVNKDSFLIDLQTMAGLRDVFVFRPPRTLGGGAPGPEQETPFAIATRVYNPGSSDPFRRFPNWGGQHSWTTDIYDAAFVQFKEQRDDKAFQAYLDARARGQTPSELGRNIPNPEEFLLSIPTRLSVQEILRVAELARDFRAAESNYDRVKADYTPGRPGSATYDRLEQVRGAFSRETSRLFSALLNTTGMTDQDLLNNYNPRRTLGMEAGLNVYNEFIELGWDDLQMARYMAFLETRYGAGDESFDVVTYMRNILAAERADQVRFDQYTSLPEKPVRAPDGTIQRIPVPLNTAAGWEQGQGAVLQSRGSDLLITGVVDRPDAAVARKFELPLHTNILQVDVGDFSSRSTIYVNVLPGGDTDQELDGFERFNGGDADFTPNDIDVDALRNTLGSGNRPVDRRLREILRDRLGLADLAALTPEAAAQAINILLTDPEFHRIAAPDVDRSRLPNGSSIDELNIRKALEDAELLDRGITTDRTGNPLRPVLDEKALKILNRGLLQDLYYEEAAESRRGHLLPIARALIRDKRSSVYLFAQTMGAVRVQIGLTGEFEGEEVEAGPVRDKFVEVRRLQFLSPAGVPGDIRLY